ncbi:TetR/AcrR family transcriptional regulator [Maridesulfovibrio sp.]|uniref:TetR/AcrR family transcriptional regulator n=1 Tax=unclassified Maridesulfovibrio TaxID=2794999 RepID=UPI003AFF7BA4
MTKAKTGRPRSEKAREAVLAATRELLSENEGGALSIEAIARRGKVGKPTIYRWWPSIADIVLEAMLHEADESIPVPESAPLADSLRCFLRDSMQSLNDGAGVHLRFLMAHAQKDTEFRDRFREKFVSKRRAVLRSVFEQADTEGRSLDAGKLDLSVDVVFGAMWYRLLTGHGPLDEKFADELAELAAVFYGRG